MALKDLPADAQPREKLLARGPAALADAELLAILLRTGIVGKGVLQMAQELLDPPGIDPDTGAITGGFGGIAGLLHTSAADLERIKGLGPAKRAELVAVLELARRALAQQLREREVFDSPDTVKHRAKWCCAPCTTRPPPWCWPTTTRAAAYNPAALTRP